MPCRMRQAPAKPGACAVEPRRLPREAPTPAGLMGRAAAPQAAMSGPARPWDSDGNYLATCQAPETVENGLRPSAVDNFISITVLTSPWRKSPLHSSGDASRLTALFVGYLCPICALLTPCQAGVLCPGALQPTGASPLSVQRGVSPRAATVAWEVSLTRNFYGASSWEPPPRAFTMTTSMPPSGARPTRTSSMRLRMKKMPRPLDFSRFSGASGSAIATGSKPLP